LWLRANGWRRIGFGDWDDRRGRSAGSARSLNRNCLQSRTIFSLPWRRRSESGTASSRRNRRRLEWRLPVGRLNNGRADLRNRGPGRLDNRGGRLNLIGLWHFCNRGHKCGWLRCSSGRRGSQCRCRKNPAGRERNRAKVIEHIIEIAKGNCAGQWSRRRRFRRRDGRSGRGDLKGRFGARRRRRFLLDRCGYGERAIAPATNVAGLALQTAPFTEHAPAPNAFCQSRNLPHCNSGFDHSPYLPQNRNSFLHARSRPFRGIDVGETRGAHF
jgi:hypothetical protein